MIDGNPALAARVSAAETGAELVVLEQRGGLARARNAGVAVCGSDIVMFLDDDAIAEDEWVERLAAAIEVPGVLGASGHSEPLWSGSVSDWVPPEFMWMLGASYRGQPESRMPVRNVYGGCCGMRREIFTELGGYNPALGRGPHSHGGGEEAELCLRASARWPERIFYYEPAARIKHRVGEERVELRYLVRRAYDEGRMKGMVGHLQPGGLSPERAFAAHLPAAFLRELAAGLRGDTAAIKRAGMILLCSLSVALGLARSHVLPGRPVHDAEVGQA